MFKKITMLIALAMLLDMTNITFAQTAKIDTVSIYDIQHVADPETDDLSPLLGDTVVVKGMVMSSPRDLWVGSRWAVYVVDPDSFPKPWSGFFVIQHDTFQVNTNFQFLQPGMICYFTGVVDEYNHFTQLNIYGQGFVPEPVIPVEILSSDNPLPDPVVLTAADLQTRAAAEQWESMWVRFENVRIVNNNLAGYWASVTDASGGTTFLAEYFGWFYNNLRNDIYDWPSPGTRLNAVGFTRDEPGGFTLNPRTPDDLEILSNPPTISDVTRNPGVPTSSDIVTVSATIEDNGTVTEAKLHYSVDWGDFQEVTMAADGNTFSADIPTQSDGAFVRYFISAVDNEGDFTTEPGDTSNSIYFYVIRDAGLFIKDVQYTWGYENDVSGFVGQEVTLQGVVTTDSTDFIGEYYIQEADSAWSGIWVRDGNHTFKKGDWIQVTGTVQENYGVTRLNYVIDAQVITPNFGVFDPVSVKTGDLTTGSPRAEAYESVLIQVENVTVTDPFPDAPGNYGEFVVNDGSGDLRVDDLSDAFIGNLDSSFAQGDQIQKIIALGYYSYGNYKIIPRDTSDVIGHISAIEQVDNQVPVKFELAQNYPNPFNPITQIQYSIAKPGKYFLEVYNVLGQKVITLASEYHNVGNYRLQWNGKDANGNLVGSGIYFYTLRGEGVYLTRKMVFLK